MFRLQVAEQSWLVAPDAPVEQQLTSYRAARHRSFRLARLVTAQ